MQSQWVQFGDYQIDLKTGDLLRSDGPARLQPLPSRVLALLVSRAGALVTRDEIKQQVWGENTFGADQALNAAIRQIRIALDDCATEPRFVATVPRRGYRFIGTPLPGKGPSSCVRPIQANLPDVADEKDTRGWVMRPATRTNRRRRLTVLVAAAGILVALLYGIAELLPADGGAGGVKTTIGDVSTLPEDLRLEYLKARELLHGGDPTAWDKAAAGFDLVRRRRPDFLPATAGAGHAALRLGDYERAAGLVAWTLAVDSLNGEAHLVLGTTLLQRGEWVQAGGELERARRLSPDLVGSYIGLALLRALDGRADSAVALAETALERDPISAITYGDAGYVALWAERPDLALRWCGHARDLQPSSSTPLYCLLDAHHALGQPEAGREQALAIMRRLGAGSEVLQQVMSSSAAEGLHRYRIWQMERLDPDGAEPSSLAGPLAFLHMQDGDPEAALRLLEIAAEMNPARFRLTLLDPAFGPLRDDPRLGRLTEQSPVP